MPRSQFVFTQVKGREAIFWQTQKTARATNPGGRIPRRRIFADAVTIAVDTREHYPYRLTQQGAETVRATVPAGDYAVQTTDGAVLAAVERKSPGEPRRHALRRNARRTRQRQLARRRLARLEVRYPEDHLVFADTRRFADEWTYRFLTTALTNAPDPSPNG